MLKESLVHIIMFSTDRQPQSDDLLLRYKREDKYRDCAIDRILITPHDSLFLIPSLIPFTTRD